jgi:hypothetical protein
MSCGHPNDSSLVVSSANDIQSVSLTRSDDGDRVRRLLGSNLSHFTFFLFCDFLLKRWIVTALLSLDGKVFARAVLRLLCIASESLKLLDFASCQSIVMSLRHPALLRLRSLWEVVDLIVFLLFLDEKVFLFWDT